MLTLRGLPPAASDHPDPLLAAYYHPLLAAWGTRERTAARLIDRYWVGVGAEPPAKRFGVPTDEWPICRGLVPAEGFVSMAARKGLHRMINPGAFPLSANRFKDKGLFAKAAAEANLPIPDSLTDACRTGPWLAAQEAVMVKPSFSSHGRGIERFRRANGGWHGSRGKEIGHGGFERLVRRTLEARGVIQAALATDASLVDISPGALPTLRLVTLRDEAGRPEIALRVLRVGGGSSPVDNFAFGGLAMEIDAEGRGRTAFARGADSRPSATKRHPQTGARLDVTLPRETVDRADGIAIAGHDALGAGYSAIAWDVGLSDAGPVLIEANWNPGTNIMQLLQRRPLSDGRIGALYRLALTRVPEATWAAARAVESDGR